MRYFGFPPNRPLGSHPFDFIANFTYHATTIASEIEFINAVYYGPFDIRSGGGGVYAFY